MTRGASVALVKDPGDSFVFEVSVDVYSYKVTMTRDYYLKLTGGKIAPETLVEKSFEFLLEREGPGSILPEFDLPAINHYFPEYEETIKQL